MIILTVVLYFTIQAVRLFGVGVYGWFFASPSEIFEAGYSGSILDNDDKLLFLPLPDVNAARQPYLEYWYEVVRFQTFKKLSHHMSLEIFWTVLPSIILLLIAIPSFALLYAIDEIIDPAISFRIIGHQWY